MKSKTAVPGLDDNAAYTDGLALLKADGHEASSSIKHRRQAREFNEDAVQLGVNYPQDKQRLAGLVAQRTIAARELEQLTARLVPLKTKVETLDKDIEKQQTALDASPEEARRDFAAELVQIDRKRHDEAREADRCRSEGWEIPADVVSRSIELEKERDALTREQAERDAMFAGLRDSAQEEISGAIGSLVGSLRSCIERQSNATRKSMAGRLTLHKLFPEYLASDVRPFWDRARQAAQLVVRLDRRGTVEGELEQTFWPDFDPEMRDRFENALLQRRQSQKPVSPPAPTVNATM